MQNGNVLFVDDELSILQSIKRAIIDEPFQAFFASTAEEALILLAEKEFSILITDMRMPGKNGLWLLQETKRLYPDTLRIILSGYSDLSEVLLAVNQGDLFRFITKPWDMENDLLPVLRLGVEYYQLRLEKKRREDSQAQRNIVYKKMLDRLSPQINGKQNDLNTHKKVCEFILAQLFQFLAKSDSKLLQTETLSLLQSIMSDYDVTLPAESTDFRLSELAAQIRTYFTVHAAHQTYHLAEQDAVATCCGNWRLLKMLLLAKVRLIGRLSPNRHFKATLTAVLSPDKKSARISHVLDLGYIDGGNILIDQNEWLNCTALDFYASILNKMGSFHNIHVTFTYISPQSSLLSLEAQLDIPNPPTLKEATF